MTNPSAPNHFMAYVRWDIILDWKAEEIKAGRLLKSERLKPYAYGTGAPGISAKIKEGDIVWIFTIPKYDKYLSYPSLNTMITVAEVIDRQSEKDEKKLGLIPDYIKAHWNAEKKKGWRYVIIGNRESSHYFPINNAYPLIVSNILQEKTIEVERKVSGEHFGHVAQYFQTVRKINTEYKSKILEFQEKIDRSDTVFISYRRGRGARIIKMLAESLLKEGLNCWLDINRMPQDIPSSIDNQAKQYFMLEIKNAIEESKIFLAAKRDDYFER